MQPSQAHMLHLQTTVQSMDQSDEDVVITQSTTDHFSGSVTVKHFRYHPKRIAEMSKKRMAICNTCEHLTKLKKCKLCGCLMLAKVAIPFVSCPDDKWPDEQLTPQ